MPNYWINRHRLFQPDLDVVRPNIAPLDVRGLKASNRLYECLDTVVKEDENFIDENITIIIPEVDLGCGFRGGHL